MEAEIIWLAPLLILPGVGLLITSTSNRFDTLHDEIHHWLEGEHDQSIVEQAHLIARARHFRNALVALYSSVFVFALASIIGAALDFLNVPTDVVVFAIAVLGILGLGYASSELIREARRSLEVIASHVDHIMEEMENDAATN